MSHILALDQGTTSSRALLINKEGVIISSSQHEFPQLFPMPGWVEHDPLTIWQTQEFVAKETIYKAGISGKEIAAIGITNQRESTVIWEKSTGKPVYQCIVWQDRRTAEYCKDLKEKGLEPLFRKKTGLLLDPYFSGTKIHWILKNVPGVLEKARKGLLAFGTIDTWLLWNLSKGQVHMTDVTNASRTLIYNIHSGCWDDELLEILEIPHSLLPQVCNSSKVYANTDSAIFGSSIPIAGMAGDQQAALFGQTCFSPGMTKTTYGTGCFMLMHTGREAVTSKYNLLTTMACKIDETKQYALEGSVFVGGAVVQWLRDSLGIIKTSEEIEYLASRVKDSDGVYFVPAFTGLGAPHWDPNVRGMILGITRGTTAAHLARAAIESIAFQVADVLGAMQSDAHARLAELRVDGGASVNSLLMQFQADLVGVPVIRPKITEITGLGAAYLAGLAIGFWKDIETIKSLWQTGTKFSPSAPRSSLEEQKKSWKKALKCAQSWGAKS